MISRCGLMKRKEGMSMEEFRDYWFNVHGPIGCQMKNLRRYEQNIVVDNEQRSPFGRGPLEIDGYSELFFDNIHDMNEGVASLDGKGAADLPYFADPDVKILVFSKKVDTRVPEELKGQKLIKRMSFLGRGEGISAERFQYEWWELHSRMVKDMPGYVGYNQNIVIDRIVNGKSVPYEEVPVEGMVEFWFKDMDGFNECYSSEAFFKTAAHGKTFIGDITTYLVEAQPYPIPEVK